MKCLIAYFIIILRCFILGRNFEILSGRLAQIIYINMSLAYQTYMLPRTRQRQNYTSAIHRLVMKKGFEE